MTYGEKAAVSSVDEVEGLAGKPGFSGNIMKLEIDVLWWGPGGNRRCIRGTRTCEHASVTWYVTLHRPISSALNFT